MAGRLPTIQEVQELVDDPQIDDDTKRTLVIRYFDAIGDVDPVVYGFENDNDKKRLLDAYQDRFDFKDSDLQDGAFAYDAYSTAKGQYDQHQEAGRQDQKRAVDDGKARLDSLKSKASDTSPGAGNSNEILDTGVAGLDSLRTWLPVYSKARAVVAPNLPDFSFAQDIAERYDEQRDIPFDKFAAGAGEVVQVRESVADAAPAQNQAMQNVFGQWDGAGKAVAAQSWTKFGDAVKTVEQTLEHAADVINRTIAAVAGSCRDKAGWALQYSFQVWPQNQGLTAQDMDRLARLAQLGRNAGDDDFKHFLGFLVASNPALGRNLLVGSAFGLTDEFKDQVQAWAKDYLTNFCTWFAGHVGNFQAMCENTRVAVAGQWSALNTELQKVPDNPFAAVGEGGQATAPTAASGSAGGGATAGGAGGSSGDAGGSAGGSGGAPAAAAPVPPAAPVPSAAPVAPASAPAPPVQPPAGDRDTLTVQRGDSRIEMTEPDRDGRMGITIDSGTGQPKDYQLNWGHPAAAEPGYTPGPDGKIHIDDQGVVITAERPQGASGPTVVTVDDGSGAPTTYTLGEEPEGAAPGTPGGAQTVRTTGLPDSGSAAEPVALAGDGGFADAGDAAEQGSSADAASGIGGAQDAVGQEPHHAAEPGDGGFGSAQVTSGDLGTDEQFAEVTGTAQPEQTVPAHAVGEVGDGLGTEGALSGSLGDPGSFGQASVPAAAGATLGTAPGFDPVSSDPGGMSALGGMPATGGGAQGDEPERTSRAYRVDGDIFETAGSAGRISGSLDDEETRR